MVNYKGGNARDLKNFRRQKLQKRRQAEADAEESPNEHEASGSQTFVTTTSPSMNIDGARPCFPSPLLTFSPSGTSFLGINANSFNYMPPHMLLTQATDVSGVKPLGTNGDFSPFGSSEAVDGCGIDQSFGVQDLGGPSALFDSPQG